MQTLKTCILNGCKQKQLLPPTVRSSFSAMNKRTPSLCNGDMRVCIGSAEARYNIITMTKN